MTFLPYVNRNLIKIKWLIYFSVSIFLMSIHFAAGPISSPDTYNYSIWADSLISHNYDFSSVFKSHPIKASYLYYVPISIFAIAKELSGDHWKIIILALNSACLPIMILLTSRVFHLTKLNKYVAAFFPLVFLFSADYLLWAQYVLTDTIYSLFLIWCFYLVILSFSKDNRDWKINLIFMVSITLLLLSRPTSPPVVIVLLFFYLIPVHIRKSRHVTRAVLCSVPIIFLAYGALLKSNIPFALDNNILNFSMSMIENGVVIHDRPETYIVYNNEYITTLKILFTRFFYFFAPYSNAFSMMHIIINTLFFAIIALPISISSVFVDGSQRTNHIVQQTKAVLVSVIIATAVLHSILLIDYDWRYRYPVIALIILLAAIEFSLFMQQTLFKRKERLTYT